MSSNSNDSHRANGRGRDRDTPISLESESTPPVMWPDEGSGFEADPFSPAGMSQQIWTATGRRPRTRLGLWFVRVVCVLLAVAFIVAQLPRW